MKKRLVPLICVFMMMASFLSVSAGASGKIVVPSKPSNSYVLDNANVLSSETESEIINKNSTLLNDTGAEIAVLTVDFISGDSIEDFANEVFNTWGIGSSERNNGLLLVLAIGNDTYYAMPGTGISDYLTGSTLKEILNDYLETDFAAKDYDAGVKSFFNEAYSRIQSYYTNYTDEYTTTKDDFTSGGGSVSTGFTFARVLSIIGRIIIGIVVLVVALFIISAFFRGGGGGGYYGGGGGGGFWNGLFLGSMLNRGRRRSYWHRPPPPHGGYGGHGGFGGRGGRGGGGGFGGFTGGGGFSGGGGAGRGGFGGGGGFSGGGGSSGGGGAGR